MKKTKILIPALSIASVGAAVIPMATITSCTSNSVLSTSDLNFWGKMHDVVEQGENAWDVAKATQEYFKDNSATANDTVDALVKNYAWYQLRQLVNYKNVSFNFYVTVNSLELGAEKEVKITRSGESEKTIKGHLISGKVTLGYNASYDHNVEPDDEYSNWHENDSQNVVFTFKNCFVSLDYTSEWKLYLEGIKAASEEWESYAEVTKSSTETKTFKFDGSVATETYKNTDSSTSGSKTDADGSVIPNPIKPGTVFKNFSSNYLTKVAHKA